MKTEIESELDIPNILIVDDIGANLRLLNDILSPEGYKIRQVPNGELALKVAEEEKPDLILLDIMMPYMNGYEVCRRLKENPELKDIPVIFISALGETNDILNAFNSGGVDYINKPIQAEEVKARVRSHIRLQQQSIVLHRQSKVLQRQSKELRDLNATKDKFFSIIAHDLRGPFNGFLGLTQLMAEDLESLSGEDIKELSLSMRDSATNVFRLLENLLEWARLQQGLIAFNPHLVKLYPLVMESVTSVKDAATKKCFKLVFNVPDNIDVFADHNMLQTVIRNLVSNAVKFTAKGGKISVSAKTDVDNTVEIAINDNGIGMNAIMMDNLFRLDVKTNREGTENEPSSGLGLILCKEFVEKHGGKIRVESAEGIGSTFYVTLPGKPD